MTQRRKRQWGVEQSILLTGELKFVIDMSIREPGQRRIFPSRWGTRYRGVQTGVMMTPVFRPFLVGLVCGGWTVYRRHRGNDPDATEGESCWRRARRTDHPALVRVLTLSTLVLRAAKIVQVSALALALLVLSAGVSPKMGTLSVKSSRQAGRRAHQVYPFHLYGITVRFAAYKYVIEIQFETRGGLV